MAPHMKCAFCPRYFLVGDGWHCGHCPLLVARPRWQIEVLGLTRKAAK